MNRKLILFFLVLSSLFSQKVRAQAHFPFSKNLVKKGYEFRIDNRINQTQKTYDQTGNEVALDNGEKYQIIDTDLFASYGYSRELQFKFGIRYRQLSSTEFGPSNGLLNSLTNSGLHSLYSEMRYEWARVESIIYNLEVGYRHFNYTLRPFDSNNPNAFLSEGNEGSSYHFGLNFTLQPKNTWHFISSRLFFRSPGKNMSNEFFYQVEGALVWKYLALMAGVEGVQSLKTDNYEDNPNFKPQIATGPSQYFNAVNPSYTNAYAGLNIALGAKYRLELRAGQTVAGENTDQFQFAMVNFVYRQEAPKGRSSIDNDFKSYGYDGEVTKVSPKGTYVVINLGLSDGVYKGMRFDIFKDDFLGGSKLVAAGFVVKLGASSCIIQLAKTYAKVPIRSGFSARGR